MKLLVLADDDGVRHDLTGKPADLVVSVGDVADPVIWEAAKLRRAKTGPNAGKEFWGCSTNGKTKCGGIREVE
jgi:hypothetical protein